MTTLKSRPLEPQEALAIFVRLLWVCPECAAYTRAFQQLLGEGDFVMTWDGLRALHQRVTKRISPQTSPVDFCTLPNVGFTFGWQVESGREVALLSVGGQFSLTIKATVDALVPLVKETLRDAGWTDESGTVVTTGFLDLAVQPLPPQRVVSHTTDRYRNSPRESHCGDFV